MPLIGDINRGRELGYKSFYNKYIYRACIDCGKERWVYICKDKKDGYDRCNKCARKLERGENSYFWKGGKRENKNGYIEIRLQPEDFFYPMVSNGYILEHRLVMAKALGRNLHKWEIVHHKGAKYLKGSIENKQDNRYPENLQLVMEGQHNQITIMENEIAQLRQRVTLLEAEIILLKGIQSFLITLKGESNAN